MAEPRVPRILVLDADETQGGRVVEILESQDLHVTYETVSADALDRLKDSQKKPFHLFISNFKLPKMAGDDILKNAKAISPLTQRMLMVSANEAGLVIRAINKAEINACIVTPASDQDLVNQVKACLAGFASDMKYEQLKRVTVHQNSQMFQMAQRLKKKDKRYQEQINEKKAEKLMLRSTLRKVSRKAAAPGTLADWVEAHNIPVEPLALETEYIRLAEFTRSLFSSAADKAGLDPPGQRLPDVTADRQTARPKRDPDREDRIKAIFKTVLAASRETAPEDPGPDIHVDSQETILGGFVEVSVSPDRIRAFVRLKTRMTEPDLLTVSSLLDLLRQQRVTYGLVEDREIADWISSATPEDEPFQVALGDPPDPGEDGFVAYHFKTDYTNPGKILEDGSIDFRDRGDIPYVTPGDLLAVKTPPRENKDGMDVSGDPIVSVPPQDPVFLAGSGTQMSEDDLSVTALDSGQPHLDPLGEITVNPELPINGDVDFKTGNVAFNGNILVRGTVKDGFQVKGINLTAAEIQGGVINVSGDLYISNGITDATIVSKGSVYARFINKSNITAFGDLVVLKEIIDSEILLSGRCENPNGMILSSKITAKGGIEAGKIGTDMSQSSQLRIGVDDHLNAQKDEIKTRLDASVSQLNEVRKKIQAVEAEDHELYGQITEKAQVQEAAQNRLKEMKAQAVELRQPGDEARYQKMAAACRDQAAAAEKAEAELNQIFEIQDQFAEEIDRLQTQMNRIEETNKHLVLKKKGLREFAAKTQADPTLIVKRRISADEVVTGPNATITLLNKRARCKITEHTESENGLRISEMKISDLS